MGAGRRGWLSSRGADRLGRLLACEILRRSHIHIDEVLRLPRAVTWPAKDDTDRHAEDRVRDEGDDEAGADAARPALDAPRSPEIGRLIPHGRKRVARNQTFVL